MDWRILSARFSRESKESPFDAPRRWIAHDSHEAIAAPHRRRSRPRGEFKAVSESASASASGSGPDPAPRLRLVTLDGSHGEGGGQILRTALTLSLLTGRPLRIVKLRANRDKPGLRPQHLTAVTSAAELGGVGTVVVGAVLGSRDLTFRPASYTPGDLRIDIGTAGATALVLQTLHLAIALRTERPVRLVLSGGTFNRSAPSFPFLATSWRAHLAALGAPIAVAMPRAGFYPRGGGELDAWIEPAQLRPLILTDRGPLLRIHGIAGVAHLNRGIAERMRTRAQKRLAAHGLEAEIDLSEWPTLPHVQGAAIALTADTTNAPPATFVGLGERGKPAEAVADEAVAELLAFLDTPAGAVDPHSADQVLLPLALAPGRSEYTVTAVTEHLRTNAATIGAFLDRSITIEEPTADQPGRVVVG